MEVAPPQNNLLGYLPLPTQYLHHWEQLCYTIIYHLCMYKVLKSLNTDDHAQSCACSVSTILKYNLYCHGMIIEEIFLKKGLEFQRLATFNEYIIKERWDLHWTNLTNVQPADGTPESYLGQSPFAADVAKALSGCKCLFST